MSEQNIMGHDEPEGSVIEGHATVIHEGEPIKTFQATIIDVNVRAKGDARTDDPSRENIIVNDTKVRKETFFMGLVGYLVKRSNNPKVKAIFQATLLGAKPVARKINSIKYSFVFNDEEGREINAYEVTLIEV